MKRRFLILSLAGALLGIARAQQPYLFTQCSTSTTPTPAYAVSVEVTVENRGKEPSKPGKVELVMTPRAPGGRPKSNVPTMWDPSTESQDLPELKPGERKSFLFKTPYYASSAYKNSRGSFKVSNVDPTGVDVQVTPTVHIK